MNTSLLRIGDEVRLREDVKVATVEGEVSMPTARIKGFLDDVPGGLFLDSPLGGIRYWNVSEVEPVIRMSDGERQARLLEAYATLSEFRYFGDGKTILTAPRQQKYEQALRDLRAFAGIPG